MKRQNYVLEHENENDRLEYQAQQRNYKPEFDFADDDLFVRNNSIIVDAGCGSGVVSRLFANKNKERNIKIFAVDNCSDERLENSKKRAMSEGFNSISFQNGDIKNLEFPDSSVDVVISRFVYEHNPGERAFKEITDEAFRVLKPNGVYYVIDADGILANMQSDNQDFLELTNKLLKNMSDVFEPYPCQKLPRFLKEAGFKFETPRHIPMIFCDPRDLEYEDELWRMRFSFFQERMVSIFQDKAQWYEDEFFKTLWSRKYLFYYNRFIFKAEKPE